MKQVMKKTSAVLFAVVMMMALVACGGGDTKESVQKTVDDLQVKMKDAMSSYQNVFQSQGATDPSQAKEMITKAAQMIDDAIAACDSVEAPGEDSQKYREAVKGFLGVMKNMMTELTNIDTSDSSAAMTIAQKYLSEMMDKSQEAQKVIDELVKKYGITAPSANTIQ